MIVSLPNTTSREVAKQLVKLRDTEGAVNSCLLYTSDAADE